MNPTAFAILVASFTFSSFLPARRPRDDKQGTSGTAADHDLCHHPAYSLMTNNRGKQPSEHKEQIDRKKALAGYIVNKAYTSGFNITNENTVSSVVPALGQ
jgi:hypothetical protein